MNFKIMPASHDDISEIIAIDKKTFMEMVDTDWYSNDCVNPKFLNFLMDGNGFVVKVVMNNQIVGFGMAEVKINPKNSPISFLHLNDDITVCGEIDNVLVSSSVRGYSLQKKIMSYLEEMFLSDTSIQILYTTVHPDNSYSLNNCFQLGYQKVMEASLYGGKRRVVLEKRIRV